MSSEQPGERIRAAKITERLADELGEEVIQDRLDYLRREIELERISYFEIAEPQGLAKHSVTETMESWWFDVKN